MAFSVASALRWWARDCPDRVALSVDDETVTFGELYAWTSRIGARLLEMGVRGGDRIAIMGVNSMEFAVLEFGAMRIGAISTPLSFRSTARELRELLTELTPVLFFADHDRSDLATEATRGFDCSVRPLTDIRALGEGAVPVLPYEPAPDEIIFIIGTSGSTGHPKGVMYSHRTLMTYAAELAIVEPRCGKGGSFLSMGPFSASSGTLQLMQFIAIGSAVYAESKFEPARALRLLVEHQITTFMGVPIFFEKICALPEFASADLSSLHYTQTAGARISPALLAAWHNKGIILRQAYGCTEAGGAWAARDDTATTEPQKCGHGGMFEDYAIADEHGNRVAAGVPGEILVRGPCLTPGYWNNPKATADAIKDGWLHTGDLGVLDGNGNLTFIDRLKDIIISGGINISAIEVERVISEVAGVEEVAVIAANDVEFGETPLAVVYGDAGILNSRTIIEYCKQHLTSYKVPRYLLLVKEPLPRVPAGKISKVALRVKYKDAANSLQKVR
jgi:fatty-acyl-CoA synthase